MKTKGAIYIADSTDQLEVMKEFLSHVKGTRLRHCPHSNVPVTIKEDHGKYLLVSVGGMIGWCLKTDLEEEEK